MIPFGLQGQENETVSNFGDSISRVTSNHSISVPLTLLGLEYGYECRMGDNFSLVSRVGLGKRRIWTYRDIPEYSETKHYIEGISVPAATLTVEPRLYTNLSRRVRLGKNTSKNSGDYVGLINKYAIGVPVKTLSISLQAVYGIRRVWRDHWLGEFSVGGGAGYYFGSPSTINPAIDPSSKQNEKHMNGFWYFQPHLQARLGYVF